MWGVGRIPSRILLMSRKLAAYGTARIEAFPREKSLSPCVGGSRAAGRFRGTFLRWRARGDSSPQPLRKMKLTRDEVMLVAALILALAAGEIVKQYRAAHPPAAPAKIPVSKK